jgi:hypothetical protein
MACKLVIRYSIESEYYSSNLGWLVTFPLLLCSVSRFQWWHLWGHMHPVGWAEPLILATDC